MALVVLMGIAYSLIIVFNTVGPFLIQTRLNYSPIFFGHLALVMGLIFLIATIICRYLLKHYKAEQLLQVVINLFLGLAANYIHSQLFYTVKILF